MYSFATTKEPPMDAYMYAASLYCEDCGAELCDDLDKEGVKDTGDSEDYPQGPYPDGGGEADCPQHCAECHVALGNDLTKEGVEYVLEHLREALQKPAEERNRIMPKPGTGEEDEGFKRTWGGSRHVEITREWADQLTRYDLRDNPEGSTPSERRPGRFVELFLHVTRDCSKERSAA